jgi:hypothetical protein
MKTKIEKTNVTKSVKTETVSTVETLPIEEVKPRFALVVLDARTGIPVATHTSVFGAPPAWVAESVVLAIGATWDQGKKRREDRWSSEISNPVLSTAVFAEMEGSAAGHSSINRGSKVGVFEFEDSGDFHLSRVVTPNDRSERNRAARAWALSVLENPAFGNNSTIRLKRDVPGGLIQSPDGPVKADMVNSGFGAPSREILGMDRFEQQAHSEYFGLADKCLSGESRADAPAFTLTAVFTQREYDLATQSGVPEEILDNLRGAEYSPEMWSNFIMNKAIYTLRRSGGEILRLFKSAIDEADKLYSSPADDAMSMADYARLSVSPLIGAVKAHLVTKMIPEILDESFWRMSEAVGKEDLKLLVSRFALTQEGLFGIGCADAINQGTHPMMEATTPELREACQYAMKRFGQTERAMKAVLAMVKTNFFRNAHGKIPVMESQPYSVWDAEVRMNNLQPAVWVIKSASPITITEAGGGLSFLPDQLSEIKQLS